MLNCKKAFENEKVKERKKGRKEREREKNEREIYEEKKTRRGRERIEKKNLLVNKTFACSVVIIFTISSPQYG